ncbi:MAG: hypothetical protein DCC65_00225 [Planctomycetota bacterium]|nr:MAG: hypothetical protein DCC65_00225 [Planctomycetota bacterium]
MNESSNAGHSSTWLISLGLAVGMVIGGLTPGVMGQIRIVNYNIAGLNGSQPALQAVFAALNVDDKPGFAVAPHLYVFQEVHSSDTAPLLTLLNAAAPPGVTYALGTYTNIGENSTSGAQAMYFRADTLVEDPAGHVDIFTQAGRYADRWRLRLAEYDSPAAVFYIYSAHLKASNTSTDASTRLTGATAIRNDADALPAGTHIIYAGDWNVYHNGEAAYLRFLAAGNGQGFDPLGTGSWAGSVNAIKHTQSPCATGCTLVAGGMDDRFDFQVSTGSFQDGEGLSLVAGTYRSFGNDGAHYDTNINSGNNSYYPTDIPRSNALAGNLKIASDHLPVVADYQFPAAMSVMFASCPCTVIVGAAASVQVTVANGPIDELSAVPRGGIPAVAFDELDYQAAGSGALFGSVSGTVFSGDPPDNVSLPIDSSVAGQAAGVITVSSTSEAVQGSPATVEAAIRVLRPANGSFSSEADVNATAMSDALELDSGAHLLSVPLFNLGFDGDQSTLEIDAVNGVALPFSGGIVTPATGIGAMWADIEFEFDTTALVPGTYENEIEILVSDEDVPGETTSAMSLTLTVSVKSATGPSTGDIDCDSDLDMDDVAAFCTVLLGLDIDACHVSQADVDTSGSANADDIQPFVNFFLSP